MVQLLCGRIAPCGARFRAGFGALTGYGALETPLKLSADGDGGKLVVAGP